MIALYKKYWGGGQDNPDKIKWFVCIFARDNKHSSTRESQIIQNFRNSDINTLNLAIQYIIDKGGFVIRLGKDMAKEMDFKHPQVIDYPFSQYRSGFMDIFLQYRARFILSSGISGCTDVAQLFGTPYCGVNCEFNFHPPYVNTICIPKKYSLGNELLGLKSFITLANNYTKNKYCFYCTEFLTDNNLTEINNTPEEILEAVKEMFERLEGSFKETQEEKALQERCKKLYITLKYGRRELVYTPIVRDFLKRNAKWYLAE